MTIKRVIPILLIFLSSIALGMFYNAYLIGNPYLDYSSMLPGYCIGIFFVLVFFILGVLLCSSFSDAFKNHKDKFSMFLGYMCVSTIVMYIMKRTHFIGVNYMNVFITIYIYPFVLLSVLSQLHKKNGSLYVSIIYAFLILICILVSDVKMLVFSLVIFVISEFVAIKLIKPINKKQWYTHTTVLCVATIILFFTRWDDFNRIITGFLNQDSVIEYKMLLNWLKNCQFFAFNPNKIFIQDIKSITACPYSNTRFST